MSADAIIDRTIRYLHTPAVVGYETPFLLALEADLDQIGRSHIRQDGLLATPGQGWVVSAHADRHGLLTTGTSTLEYAAAEVGAHRDLSPELRTSICQRFSHEMVQAYNPDNGEILAESTIQHADHCGLKPPLGLTAPELATLPAGIPVAFTAPDNQPRPGWLQGQLDNALCTAMAMQLLIDGFEGTVLFTLGEEAGRSWEALVSWFNTPWSQLLVLDTSPFDDPEPVLDGRVVLRTRDAGAPFDPDTTALVRQAAERISVPTVCKDEVLASQGKPLGRTELGRLVAGTDGRVTGSTLQIPTTDYHSNHESTSWTAVDATWRVLTSTVGV